MKTTLQKLVLSLTNALKIVKWYTSIFWQFKNRNMIVTVLSAASLVPSCQIKNFKSKTS